MTPIPRTSCCGTTYQPSQPLAQQGLYANDGAVVHPEGTCADVLRASDRCADVIRYLGRLCGEPVFAGTDKCASHLADVEPAAATGTGGAS